MKSYLIGGGLAAAAAGAAMYATNDNPGHWQQIITTLFGGGGSLAAVIGVIQTIQDLIGGKKPPTPTPDDGGTFTLANFKKAFDLFKAAKADGKVTKDELIAILKVFMPEVDADLADDDVQQFNAGFGGKGLPDVAKYAQFIGQLMQLKPVADAFKAKGGPPAYSEILLVWDATTIVPVKLGVDPRTALTPVTGTT